MMLSFGKHLVVPIILTCVSIAFAGSLKVKWNANSEDDLAGYRVHYGTVPGQYTETIDVGNVTFHIIDQLQDGETYHFAVTAYDFSGNESAFSEMVSATVEEAQLLARYLDDSFELDWSLVPDAETYEIYKTTDFHQEPEELLAVVEAPPYTDVGFDRIAGAGAKYRVHAMQGNTELYRFNTVAAFTIGIQAGRNLLSLPLIPADSRISAVMGDQAAGGTNIGESDRVYFWNGTRYEIAWLLEGSGTDMDGTWRTESGSDESSIQLDLNSSFWLMTRPGGSQTLTVTGSVFGQMENTVLLANGPNFIGMPFPKVLPLVQTELWEDGVVIGNGSVAVSDRVLSWRPDRRSYQLAWIIDQTGTEWDGKWLEESGAAETTLQLTPGYGYVLWRINPNENGVWTMPNPFWQN
ncbi:fibronectin type III domain-containing protein [candidate division KSB1 bacterium]|nr:fibronectin type III domain-containing protein [candidate division KSB1 bacterium]